MEWHCSDRGGMLHTGNSHTVGLRADGTVVATGWNKYGQCDVNDWRDIVAVAAGWRRTIGPKPDGSLVAVGRNNDGECDVGHWSEIVQIAAGDWHTIGLRQTARWWQRAMMSTDNAVCALGERSWRSQRATCTQLLFGPMVPSWPRGPTKADNATSANGEISFRSVG